MQNSRTCRGVVDRHLVSDAGRSVAEDDEIKTGGSRGNAVFYSGDKDGARKQFAIAATLEFSPADKSALAKVSHD